MTRIFPDVIRCLLGVGSTRKKGCLMVNIKKLKQVYDSPRFWCESNVRDTRGDIRWKPGW